MLMRMKQYSLRGWVEKGKFLIVKVIHTGGHPVVSLYPLQIAKGQLITDKFSAS